MQKLQVSNTAELKPSILATETKEIRKVDDDVSGAKLDNKSREENDLLQQHTIPESCFTLETDSTVSDVERYDFKTIQRKYYDCHAELKKKLNNTLKTEA